MLVQDLPLCSAAPSRQALLDEGMTWLGTPYHHQACLKGVGVDCVMLLAGIAKGCGTLPQNWFPPVYSPEWHLHQREERLVAILDQLGCQARVLPEAEPGDIVMFQYGHVLSHIGLLYQGHYVLHAVFDDCVRFRRLAGNLATRLQLAYTMPGVPT